MLLIATALKASTIHGLGLFAVEPIAKGTVLWRYTEPFDRKWTAEYVSSLPEVAQRHVFHFCARLRDGSFLVTGDNDRFWNHSDSPNCLTDTEAKETVAIRDIEAGEELTESYFQYCDDILGAASGELLCHVMSK